MSELVQVTYRDDQEIVMVTFGSLADIEEIDGIPSQQIEDYNGFSEGLYTLKPDDVFDEEVEAMEGNPEGFITWQEDWHTSGVRFCSCTRIAWYEGSQPFIYHAKKCHLYDPDDDDNYFAEAAPEPDTIIRVMKDAVL